MKPDRKIKNVDEYQKFLILIKMLRQQKESMVDLDVMLRMLNRKWLAGKENRPIAQTLHEVKQRKEALGDVMDATADELIDTYEKLTEEERHEAEKNLVQR